MSSETPVLLDFLRRLAEADSNAERDLSRLWRRWRKEGRPPFSWTIRWNPRALGLLQESVGMDVGRLQSDGARLIDMEGLSAKLGGQVALGEALRTLFDSSNTEADAAKAELLRFGENLKGERARLWLEHLLSSSRAIAGRLAEATAILKALDFVDGLNGQKIHASDLGARIGASSKFLRPGALGRRILADALLLAEGKKTSDDAVREAALDAAGILLSPTAYTVLVAGPLEVGTPSLAFPEVLADRDEAAVLTLQNLTSAHITGGAKTIYTVENESPFLGAMKEGLHREAVLVHTSGYPNRAVMTLLRLILPQADRWSHWGDTDLAGINIARVLERELGRRPSFFRCAPDDVRRLRAALIPLNPGERKDIATNVKGASASLGSDVLRTVLAEGGWLEQEAWQPPSSHS